MVYFQDTGNTSLKNNTNRNETHEELLIEKQKQKEHRELLEKVLDKISSLTSGNVSGQCIDLSHHEFAKAPFYSPKLNKLVVEKSNFAAKVLNNVKEGKFCIFIFFILILKRRIQLLL